MPTSRTSTVSRTNQANHQSVAPILDGRGPDPTPAATGVGVELAVDGDHAVAWLAGDIDLASSEHLLEMGSLAFADPE